MRHIIDAQAVPVEPSTTKGTARLLIVEDDRSIQDFLRGLLRRHGYQSYFSDSGLDVVRLRRSVRPDLIILDLYLRDLNGLEACRLLRSDEESKRLPVLMLSAGDNTGKVMCSAAMSAGATDYLQRPFGENEFLGRVRTLLKTHPAAVAPQNSGEILERGRVCVDVAARRTWVEGMRRSVAPRRFNLLCLLLRCPDGISIKDFRVHAKDSENLRKNIERLKCDLGLRDALRCDNGTYHLVG